MICYQPSSYPDSVPDTSIWPRSCIVLWQKGSTRLFDRLVYTFIIGRSQLMRMLSSGMPFWSVS